MSPDSSTTSRPRSLEPLLVFLAISWKITGAQFAFYLLLVSDPIILLEVDVGSVPGRR